MKKEDAIQLFGSVTATARAIGITAQAVSNWPAVLSRAIEDRVIAAAVRHDKLLTGLPEECVSVVTTELERLGLIEKCGNGGSQTTRYTLLAGGRK